MKPKVYIETSIVSYLTARPSRDLIIAAHQQLTYDWWRDERGHYELFVSQAVLDEAGAGDPAMAQARMEALNSLTLLKKSVAEDELAEKFVKGGPLPPKAAIDALHIAAAAIHGLDYLLTWNCKHIANAQMWPGIDKICRRHGYEPPMICTPLEMMGLDAEF
jgi:hypothetical protein